MTDKEILKRNKGFVMESFYYLIEYGVRLLLDESEISKIKESYAHLCKRTNKSNIYLEQMLRRLDGAVRLAKLSYPDLIDVLSETLKKDIKNVER